MTQKPVAEGLDLGLVGGAFRGHDPV